MPDSSFIQDETLVPAYHLPPLLQMQGGTSVATAAQWRETRRAELVELFATHVYGRTPAVPVPMQSEVVESRDFGAMATRTQVALHLGAGPGAVQLNVLLYLPRRAAPVPLFMGLNFHGNHTVCADPAIALPQVWVPNEAIGAVEHRATEAGRGAKAERWPLQAILERGYGLATAYCGDLDPDFDDGFANGAHGLLDGSRAARAGDAWGTVGAWAWGLCRMLDYLSGRPDIDGRRVAVLGHSRLGKAALWAGAQDERFAMVISNESGCTGAALARRCYGESLAHINSTFPHWFCANYHAYGGRESALPIDQHQLLALMAPRPLYVASAAGDQWADPRGEWLALVGAAPAYELLGAGGLETAAMPAIGQAIYGKLGYHIREGEHELSAYDWERYLDFADRYL